ncbi:MAG: porin family protein [Bacteroidia bacterium]|nr:porin family protein [Bacteroidia bacterium]
MKTKSLFTIVLALLIAVSASGQGFHFGVKGGVSGNWMPGTNLNVDDYPIMNVGFYGGVTGTFFLSDMTFLQAEAIYTRKGVSTNSEITGKYSRNISYIQVPVFFGFAVGSDDALRFMVGPEFAFAVGNQVVTNAALNPAGGDKYKPAPFNFGIGLQVSYFVTDGLAIDLRFDKGFTRTLKPAVSTAVEDKGTNLGVMLGVSYMFGN